MDSALWRRHGARRHGRAKSNSLGPPPGSEDHQLATYPHFAPEAIRALAQAVGSGPESRYTPFQQGPFRRCLRRHGRRGAFRHWFPPRRGGGVRLIAPVLKTGRPSGLRGSNPLPSASSPLPDQLRYRRRPEAEVRFQRQNGTLPRPGTNACTQQRRTRSRSRFHTSWNSIPEMDSTRSAPAKKRSSSSAASAEQPGRAGGGLH